MIMRDFVLLLIFCLVSTFLIAQQTPKEIMGSFAYNNKVYNYTYTQHSRNFQHSFQINPMGYIDKNLSEEISSFVKDFEKSKDFKSFADSLKSFNIKIELGKKIYIKVKKLPDSLQKVVDTTLKVRIEKLVILKRQIDTTKNKIDTAVIKKVITSIDKKILDSWSEKIKNGKIDSIKSVIVKLIDITTNDLEKQVENAKTWKEKAILILEKIKNFIDREQNFEPSYFGQFDVDIFQPVFESELGRFEKQLETDLKDDKKKELVKKLAYSIFFSIKTRIDFLDDEPITAYLFLRSEKVEINNKEYKIKEVTAEFEDGTIKNIFVDVFDNENVVRRFRNNMPISITGKFSPDLFLNIRLYCPDFGRSDYFAQINGLNNVLFYKIVLSNNNEDYSPASKCVTLSTAAGENYAELKKEQRSKIFELKTFSDFVGIDSDQPNGLIQLEIAKKLNINSTHGQGSILFVPLFFLKYISGGILPSIKNYTNQVFFSTIEFKGRLSKIDQNNRDIILTTKDTLGSMPLTYKANVLELYKRQTASFGFDLTAYRYNITQLALDLQGFIGAYWMRSSVIDSLSKKVTAINSAYWKWGLLLEFNPDSRVGFTARYEWQKINVLSDYLQENFKGSLPSIIKTYSFDVFFKTNTNSKIFGRFGFNVIDDNPNKNFVQVQVGYSSNLFAPKK